MAKECCSNDEGSNVEGIEIKSPRTAEQPGPKMPNGHLHDNGHDHSHGEEEGLKQYIPTVISFFLLVSGIALEFVDADFFKGLVKLGWFGLAYFLVGGKVLKHAWLNIKKGEIFNEFFLMSIATLGAFYLGEYAEGVAVMLFYVVGEHFQEAAVLKSRRSIKALIDNRPETVSLLKNGSISVVNPELVSIGDTIQVKPGEKVALDGELVTKNASFNSAALTGESNPDYKEKGDKVLAGMINLDKVAEIRVSSKFEDSALSKILALVDQASGRKAKTQQFITKFAKVYTPFVVFLAIGITFFPYFIVETYHFEDWLYKALVFLVISCPCALVISIPLGYFGGIGAASRNGILFKGANFLDLLRRVDTVVMDKTGTLTKGVFQVQQVKTDSLSEENFLKITAALESNSTHPIANAVVRYAGESYKTLIVENVEEIPGYGLKGIIDGKNVLAGNPGLLKKYGIEYDTELERTSDTLIAVAIEGKYEGHISISDEIKEDAEQTIINLKKSGITNLVMLSGDKLAVVETVAKKLGISNYFGGLLPEDKVNKVEELKAQGKTVAFVGDGINDAPVIALADVGIAMGGLGSDAAIETADVVIQNDQPSKIYTAITIGKKTNNIVWQNIAMAFGVKAIVLILGAGGLATMWEAVFADVGVALLAILNAVRIQRMRF